MINNSVAHYNYLVSNKLTFLKGYKLFISVVYYSVFFILMLLLTPFFYFWNEKRFGKIVYVSWSDTHTKTLSVISQGKVPYQFRGLLCFSVFLSPFKLSTLLNVLLYEKSTKIFSLSGLLSFFEVFIISSWLKNNAIDEVYISAHYDRLAFNFSTSCYYQEVKLIICQHGVISKIDLPSRMPINKVYLKYPISEEYFRSFLDSDAYVYSRDLDFDRNRILNGESLKESDGILVVGQFGQTKNTLRLLNVLNEFKNVNIYYLVHPSDKNGDFGEYAKIVTEPISNPRLVISLFSSLAYSYHLLGFRTIFLSTTVDVDFYMDPTVIKEVSLGDISRYL